MIRLSLLRSTLKASAPAPAAKTVDDLIAEYKNRIAARDQAIERLKRKISQQQSELARLGADQIDLQEIICLLGPWDPIGSHGKVGRFVEGGSILNSLRCFDTTRGIGTTFLIDLAIEPHLFTHPRHQNLIVMFWGFFICRN